MPSVGVIFNFTRPSSHLNARASPSPRSSARRARSVAVTFCTRNFSNSWFLAVARRPLRDQWIAKERARFRDERKKLTTHFLTICGDRWSTFPLAMLRVIFDEIWSDEHWRSRLVGEGVPFVAELQRECDSNVLSPSIRSARWQLFVITRTFAVPRCCFR